MKKNNLLYNLFLFFVVLNFIFLFSCKKMLNVDLPGYKIASEKVFEDDVTATSAVTGIYRFMYEQAGTLVGGNSVTIMTGCSSDELINTSFVVPEEEDVLQNTLRAENPAVLDIWTSSYNIIYQANVAYEGLQRSKGLSEQTKNQLTGEVLFMRALTYFYLINLFDSVPLALSSDYDVNAVLTRASSNLIWNTIIDDIQRAKELLQQNYITSQRVRPNRATASALLARVYLYRGNWSEAENEATEIINDTATYFLPGLNEVFKIASTEVVWQISPAGVGNATRDAQYFNPNNVLNTRTLRSGFQNSFETGDARQFTWMGTVLDDISSEIYYYPAKYKQYLNDGPLEEYSIVFRLAEQYLIRAESRAQQYKLTGGESAESDINKIRLRAGLPNTTASTKEELLAAVEQERKVEFFCEMGHRWLDLKRWNKAVEILSPLKSGFTASDELYPIPQSEMNKNRNLIPQNDNY